MTHETRGLASHNTKIGITQRVTPLDFAWTGDLRVRFTDFQVNEIDHNGSVVHLTSIGMGPPEAAPGPNVQNAIAGSSNEAKATEAANGVDQQDKPSAPVEDANAVSEADAAILADLGGQSFADGIIALYKSIGPNTDYQTSVQAQALEKDKRGQLHQEVRRIFNSKLDTSTSDDGNIIAKVATKKSRNRGRGGRGKGQNKPTGEFLHFTLYKDNRDTMEAINQLARTMNIKPQLVAYAGTKDRRASTAQRCSIRYSRERFLANANSKLRGIVTGDYEYKDMPVWLGQLQGNEFIITIKNCGLVSGASASSAQSLSEKVEVLRTGTQAALQHMTEHGWINYFGNQRFGTREVGTHDVGQLILGDKFEEAVHALLKYDPEIAEKAEASEDNIPAEPVQRDEVVRHQACMLFMTDKDAERAARIIPRRSAAESCIIRHLTRSGQQSRRDFVGAIVHITRGLRSMYLHAYQSHVWNHAASRRWELHGSKVVAGDLVLSEQAGTSAYGGKDADGDDIFNPVDDDADGNPTITARALTEEEAASGRFTIFDVVLPVPGYEVIYPSNELGVFYEEFMARPENGSLDPHNMRRRHREFSLPGRYRKLMGKFLPGGGEGTPSVEVRTYADDIEQMHPTDLDNVRAKLPPRKKRAAPTDEEDRDGKRQKVEGDDAAKSNETLDREDNAEAMKIEDALAEKEAESPKKEADKIAVVVKFRLGSSAYATVALRELMGDPPEDQPVTVQ
ncbi:tRNA pseudouridine synthase D (TruD) domain-containing protein [Sarocladium implicatum]|nr:tRNA pseudouridine synthase D (TruD) domain-containing protein [Sarocladium implicatum]